MNKKKCLTGKNAYETEQDAQKAADLGMYLSKEKNLILNTYFCMQCFQWHLTSSKRNKK